MKIVIVSPYDPRADAATDPAGLRGGVEEALDGCASGLAKRGHDVTLLTSAPRDGDARDEDGVRVIRVKRRGMLFRTPIAPLARRVPADADVVHVPATYPGVSDIIPLLARRRKQATVLDYHFDVAGTSAAMRAGAAAHLATMGSAMRAATRVACKSLDYARASPFLRGVDPARLDWVPNGVDCSEFRADRLRGEHIACVGRLVPYKGVDVLLRAMPEVHAMTGARLLVAGDGPEAARLRAMAPECVDMLGRVSRERLRDIMETARVVVLPSANRQEAFGICLLEAMAAGAPVVASDLPGVREVARTAGLTARAGDPAALARAIIETWKDPRAFGSPADIRARVERRYDWSRILPRLEQCYQEAVA